MTLTIWQLCALAAAMWLVGVVCGIALREAFVIARTGHTSPMLPSPGRLGRILSRAAARTPWRAVGAVAVILAMFANAASVVLTLANGQADQDRVNCTIRYNQLDGEARDERDARNALRTDSELKLWLDLRKGIRTSTITSESLDRAITAHIRALQSTKKTRIENPYPPADLCGSPSETASPDATVAP